MTTPRDSSSRNVPTYRGAPRVDRTEQGQQRGTLDQTDMIARFSHEIRSPLHTILGIAELLTSTSDLTEKQRAQVDIIMDESHALRAMIDDILDLSRLSSGQMELTSEVFSPSDVVHEVGRSFELACADKGLELTIDVDDGVPPAVRGDALRVRQVLVNLVSNAVRYTDRGSVRLRAVENIDASIRFEVTDSGPGIPRQIRAEIFEPFTRGSRGQGGTGLGLAISKHLIELMDGTLGFETGDDGTAFWCDIAFGHARRASDRDTGRSRTIVRAPTNACVLVVDDSEVNRLLASSQLERLGYQFTTAESGEEALRRMRAEHYDAVLMDWHMPGIDGLEATSEWRANETRQPPLPIITVTASAMAGDRERCLEAGASDYLAKPVSITDLGSTLARWTRTSEGSAARPPRRTHDRVRIAALIDDLGDIDVVRSVLDASLDTLPRHRAAAQSGLDSGDITTVRRSAHTVKSTAIMLGADDLADVCRDLEQSTSNDRTDLAPLVDAFDRRCREAEADLAALAASLGPEPA